MVEGPAYFQLFLAALHVHDLTATEVAADLVDRIDANDRGAMDLPEFVRIELGDELLDRLAYERLEAWGLDPGVFVLRTKEQDVARRDHSYIGANARLHPTHVLAWFEISATEALR